MGRRAIALELLVFYVLVFGTIWGGQLVDVRPPAPLAAVLLFGFCFWSARRHGDTRETVGWDRRWLGPCARETLKWAGPVLLVLLIRAVWPPLPTVERLLYGAQGLPPSLRALPGPVIVALGLLRYPLWALAQELALLSFLANRWRVLAGGPWRTALINGALFSLVHAPNPILMAATFAAGVAFTRIFLKTPHLLPLALAHGAAGLLLSVIFRDFYPAMMVGPAYLRYGGLLGGR